MRVGLTLCCAGTLCCAALQLPTTSRPAPRCRRRSGGAWAQEGADNGEGPLGESPVGHAGEPPEYPEGLHNAAKADRRGPYWSSLGEPDVSTGARPNYLRRDDWHISSLLTNEERDVIDAEEIEWSKEVESTPETVAAELEALQVVDDAYDPFTQLEFMKVEDRLVNGGAASKLPMPKTWQEYQYLQEQMGSYSLEGSGASPAQMIEAASHGAKLAEFYQTFKDILAEGWTLLNNPLVEDAAQFLLTVQRQTGDVSMQVDSREVMEVETGPALGSGTKVWAAEGAELAEAPPADAPDDAPDDAPADAPQA